MKLSLKLAWRNLWRNKRRTLIVVMAMGMTMALLVMYDGLLAGFEDGIYSNAIKLMGGNIQVHGEGYEQKFGQTPLLPMGTGDDIVAAAESQPNVTVALRRINTGGMATNREGAYPISIVGLEPEREIGTSVIAENIVAGRYLTSEDEDLLLIGQGLADVMEIGIGDRITLSGNTTHEEMRQRTMTIIGIYDIGMATLEKRSVFVSLAEAQALYGLNGEISEVIILVEQVGQEPKIVETLNAQSWDYEITTWETSIPELSQTADMKSGVMTIFGIILLGIAGIGIFNIQLMAIYERTREIGLLGAMGLKPRQITFLFLLEGILIGVVGAIVGTILGIAFTGLLGYFGIDYSAFTEMTDYMALMGRYIYPTIVYPLVFQRAITVAIIAAFAAFYPALEASRREPAEALHYV